MNVVHIPRRFDTASWGGTEQVVWQIGRAQHDSGHEAAIFCPDAPGRRAVEEMRDGVRVRHFPYFYPFVGLSRADKARLDKKGGNIFSWALWRALRRAPDLDLIHLHTLKRIGGIGRAVARARGLPYLVHLHGGLYDVPASESDDMIRPIRHTLEWGKALGALVGARRVVEDAAAVVCVGRSEARAVAERHPGKRVMALPNGVDMERFARGDGARFRKRMGLASSDRVICQVARLDHQKNQLFAVEAMPEILARCREARLVLVGPTTNAAYVERIRDAIGRADLGSRVLLTGAVDARSDELADAYHAADVVVLPSLHEPFGIAILEAWAAGRPVVAARVGGIPDFVTHEVNGRLFDSGAREAFVAAVAQTLSEGAEGAFHALGAAGRDEARRRYTWREVTRQLLDLYEEVRHAHSVSQ